VYQVSQPLLVSSNWSRSVDSENTWLPTMRISLMRAASPSLTVKVTLTRLRSSGVIVVTTSAPYRLRDRYWRLISCSARSISARSKGRPSPMPPSRSDFSSGSLSNSFSPAKVMVAMIERSSTMIVATSPSTSMRTSLKRPVAKRARRAAAPFSSL
jgi:hypothetical protein